MRRLPRYGVATSQCPTPTTVVYFARMRRLCHDMDGMARRGNTSNDGLSFASVVSVSRSHSRNQPGSRRSGQGGSFDEVTATALFGGLVKAGQGCGATSRLDDHSANRGNIHIQMAGPGLVAAQEIGSRLVDCARENSGSLLALKPQRQHSWKAGRSAPGELQEQQEHQWPERLRNE